MELNIYPMPSRILLWMQQNAPRRTVATSVIVEGIGEQKTSSRLRMALKRLVETGCVCRLGTDSPAKWELTRKGRAA